MNSSKKSEVAIFIYHHPRATISLVSEAVSLDNSTCSTVLSKLVREGKAIREKDGRTSIYSAAPDFTPEDRPEPPPATYSTDEIAKKERVISELESRGLWRRALTELGILAGMQQTATGVSVIAQRRCQCMRNLAK
jgi:hypothetical protein